MIFKNDSPPPSYMELPTSAPDEHELDDLSRRDLERLLVDPPREGYPANQETRQPLTKLRYCGPRSKGAQLEKVVASMRQVRPGDVGEGGKVVLYSAWDIARCVIFRYVCNRHNFPTIPWGKTRNT